jgi:pimeloyl-ACP methyl ester carboxylesterase
MATLARPHGPLHYEVTDVVAPWQDEPETILFHHGLGITSDIWLEWLAPLADRYRLVRFDCRGFGRSSVPGPGFAWSMELLAADALAVARAAGAERFHYVGESLGDASPFIPLPMALELHARVPHSELRIFPGARHALAHTHARSCAAAMLEFLARRVSPAA